MHKIVNGQRVELTAEEVTQREAEEVQWAEGAYDRAMVDLPAGLRTADDVAGVAWPTV